jgi:anthranilate phosphoribosyltransferase
MLNRIQHYIAQIIEKRSLSREDAGHAFQIVMNGGASPALIAALLVALRCKGESVEEITGAAEALRARMLRIPAPPDVLDVCGTGGDNAGTLNISTAVALVVASCGVPVAKHGNSAVSSRSGSADVLKALGVQTAAPVTVVEHDRPVPSPQSIAARSLQACNICFLHAGTFHPAMRHIAPVRQELGIRTLFNLLGPLCNPASPKKQLMGVYAPELTGKIAQALKALGSERAWVVHGEGGLDELSLSGPSQVTELLNGDIRTFTIQPEDAGFASQPLDALAGQGPEENARAITQLLAGHAGPYRDIVLLNAAAALIIAGKAESLREGASLAADAINSGKARETLATLVQVSNAS